MPFSSDANGPPNSKSGNGPSGSRRQFLRSGAVLGALALAPGATAGARTRSDGADRSGYTGDSIPEGPTVALERVASGLTAPVSLEAPPTGDDLFVVDQVGQVRVVGPGGLRPEPFLDVADRIVDLDDAYDERGLLGLAFHPDFPEDDRFFVRYSGPPTDDVSQGYDHTFVLSEFRTTGDGAGHPDSERRLLEIPEPQANHNGGPITFGPDGYLYVAVGDGGGGADTGGGHVGDWYDNNAGGNGQDVTENLLGSVLRIDVDSSEDGKPYAVPGDNPLVGREGLDEHYAWGFRNPWGLSFGPDGRLFAADAGQSRLEEVDVVEAGGNYGWNVREGTDCFDAAAPGDPPEACPDSTPESVRGGEVLRDPIVEYPHQSGGDQVGLAVVGGYRSTSTGVPELDGAYVFGDWSRSYGDPSGRLFAARPDGSGGWSMETLPIEGSSEGDLGRFLLGFGRDRSGRIYALTTGNTGPTGTSGAVFRLSSPDGGDGDGGDGDGDDGDGSGDDDGSPPGDPVETLTFEGRVSAWTATAPVQIEGTENPTLELVSGMTYEVVWENADGVTHDFQVLDDGGSVLAETADVGETGATASTTFVAEESMSTYLCSFHPTTQRGSITVRSSPKSVTEAIAGPDGTVGTPELQRAISLWATGDPVPEADGKTVTTADLQEVIRRWATGDTG